MVTVVDVPVIGGNMDGLREHADAIARGGRGVADTGAEVHRTWQGLRLHYRAPEAETLLAATAPVAEVTAAVGESTEAAAGALTVYADVVTDLQRQLDALRENAATLTAALDTDPTLHSDPGIGAEAERVRGEVDRVMTEYLEAQQDCAAALRVITTGGSVPWAAVGLGIVPPAYAGYAAAPENDPTYRPWGWRDVAALATPIPVLPGGDVSYPVLPPAATLGGIQITVPGPTGPLTEITPVIPPITTDRGFTPAPGFGISIDAADPEGAPAWPPPEVTTRVPREWGEGSPNRGGIGIRWEDPEQPGSGIRIDQGNPENSQPTQQVDHVVVRRNGVVIGRDGDPLPGSIKQHPELAHIPLAEWLTWRSWWTP